MLRDFVIIATRAFALLLITVFLLEFTLQLAFPHLPKVLIEQMPQYLERIGYRLNTEHGARQLPADEVVEYEVSELSGDLYHLSCLLPADAQPSNHIVCPSSVTLMDSAMKSHGQTMSI